MNIYVVMVGKNFIRVHWSLASVCESDSIVVYRCFTWTIEVWRVHVCSYHHRWRI